MVMKCHTTTEKERNDAHREGRASYGFQILASVLAGLVGWLFLGMPGAVAGAALGAGLYSAVSGKLPMLGFRGMFVVTEGMARFQSAVFIGFGLFVLLMAFFRE